MPRKREGIIAESLRQLEQLEMRYKGKPQEARIKALRLLKQQPDLRLDDIGDVIGVSGKTIKRWWKTYREGGVTALRQVNSTTLGNSGIDERLVQLKRKIAAGDFADIDDVREWLGSGTSTPESEESARLKNAIDTPSVVQLINFLNDLPTSFAPDQWALGFRDGLSRLLPDVDRVMVGLSMQRDLLTPADNSEDVNVTQHIAGTTTNVFVVPERDMKPADRYLQNLRSRNFAFEDYHPPRSFVYYFEGVAYVGAIFLWRNRSKPAIAESTIRLMNELEPFFVFLFTDAIVRYRYARPTGFAFDESLRRMTDEAGLTMAERRVLALQLIGFSYEEMASTLNISLNTVRYHLKSSYRKTDTHSLAELYAKYFTPRLEGHKSHD